MKLKEIYDLFVKEGIKNDPRGEEAVEKSLKKVKEKYEKLDAKEREEFDLEKLTNPYADTRILAGDSKAEIKRILVGIDMEVGEVLLADKLSEKGQKIDLILSHHPEGKAWAALDEVMHVQADVLSSHGVPINVAEGMLAGRISEIHRAVSPANHNRAVDAAKILNYPLMSAHTVADNMVHTFMDKLVSEKKPETVGELVDLIKEIPEYKAAVKINAGPKIFIGSADRRTGKIAVTGMTGGTEGASELYEKMSQAGIGTIIDMHMSEEHKKEAEKHHINVVIAGHMASDSLGMNLLLDQIEKKGVEIVPVSGLIRIKRT